MTVESPEQSLRRHLDAGERLLWSGRPRQGFVFGPIDFLLVLFSLLWGGFAFFWTYSVLTQVTVKPGPIGLPFMIFGIFF